MVKAKALQRHNWPKLPLNWDSNLQLLSVFSLLEQMIDRRRRHRLLLGAASEAQERKKVFSALTVCNLSRHRLQSYFNGELFNAKANNNIICSVIFTYCSSIQKTNVVVVVVVVVVVGFIQKCENRHCYLHREFTNWNCIEQQQHWNVVDLAWEQHNTELVCVFRSSQCSSFAL